ncbi:MAG: TonB-dependent receptor [Caulobacterales bacterium]
MSRRALRLTVSVSAIVASFAAAQGAHAVDANVQAEAATPVTTATAADINTVPTLNITAERRTINLQTAPLAASVIGGNQLQTEGIQGLDDLQFHTPSLTVADFGQGQLFNIRGIGKDLTNVQTPSGVVTYWDGIASFPGFFADAPYYDIANVEILRGPQGTFAGQNATGGAVFITTNDARLGVISGDIEASYGSYNDTRLRGFWNIPLSDTLAVRIAAQGETRDSFYKVSGPWTTPFNGTPGRQLLGSARLSVLWQPTDAFKVTFKAQANYLDHGGFLEDTVLDPAHPTQLNPANPFHISSFINDYATDKGYTLTLNAGYTFSNGIVLKSITGFENGSGNANIDLPEVGPGSLFEDYGREQIFSQELNLVSPDKGPFRWIGGLYYQHDYVTLLPGGGAPGFDIHVVFPGGFEDILLTYRTPKTTEAVFGKATYDITPALQLEAGARYTSETFGLKDDLPTVLTLTGVGSFTLSDPSYNVHTTNSGVTGKVALNWKLDDNNFLYFFVATGRKAAGINTNPTLPQTVPFPFAPETVTDIEAGWKPTLFDGHVRAQLNAYYSLYSNFQLSFGLPNQPTQSFIRNVGGTTTLYGLEAQAQAVFGPWAFDLTGSYEHSQLGSFSVADPVSGLPTQLGGRSLPLAPEFTFSAGAQYKLDLPNGATLTPRVDYSYVSGQWGTPYQDFGDYLPARNLVNAQIVYAQDKYLITAYATNAFNLRYIIGLNIGLRTAGNPGQYGIRVERKF